MSSKLKLSLIIYCGTVFLLHLVILNVRQYDKVHEWCTGNKFVKGRIIKTVKAYWSSELFVSDVLLGKEPDTRQLTWNGSGQAVSKAISCAEIMKRQFKVRRDALQRSSVLLVCLFCCMKLWITALPLSVTCTNCILCLFLVSGVISSNWNPI